MSGHVALIACLALVGLALGWPQRTVIARYVPDVSGAYWPVLAAGIVTAALLVAIGARVHGGFVLGTVCCLAAIAVPLAFIDAAVRRLPDSLTGAAYAVTIIGLLIATANGGHWSAMERAALGGIALAGFYLLLALISPSGMGPGDVKLAASLGTLLAWTSWRALVFGGFAGFGLGAVYSVALLAVGRTSRKQHIPFGPFMIAGAFLLLLA
jgi:prepilin signal peptidase PulO-like enzyme (type II secretory pathway)